MTEKISACIIVKNEEKFIENCLKSIKDVVNEIIIVDSFSTDKTVEICKKYTNKIHQKKWENSFAKQRNFAISKATGNWVLYIDADETLHAQCQKEIKTLINQKEYQGFTFRIRFYIDDKRYLKHGIWYAKNPYFRSLRLFKKDVTEFVRDIHEVPVVKGNVGIAECIINHDYRRFDYKDFKTFPKLLKYAKNHAEWLNKTKKANLLVIFLRSFGKFFKYLKLTLIDEQGYKDGLSGLKPNIIYASYHFMVEITRIYLIANEWCKRVFVK